MMNTIGENLSYKLSNSYFERAKKIIPGGVHSPVRSFKNLDRAPVFFEKGDGPYLYSVDGERYIDYCLSFGPLILGHQAPAVKAEVLKMLDKGWTFGACEKYSLDLAEWMVENIPFIDKLRFVSSGTEAVMSALRIARAVTGKNKILKFDGCYHGHVDSLLVKSGSGLAGESSTSSAGISPQVGVETLVCELNDLQKLEEIITREKNSLAAVIIEPIPANYGLLIQTKEFLHGLQNLCKKNNILLILDEVISGFRVSLGGMTELYNLNPDLVCYGKIIGGGFPVGCYAGKAEFMNQVAPLGNVYQAGTLSANPVGMVAGLVTLKTLKSENIYAALDKKTAYLADKLNSFFSEAGLGLTCTHFQSLFWIHAKARGGGPIRAISEIPDNQGALFKNLFLKALDRNLYLAPNAYEVGFLSAAHSQEVLDETLHTIKTVYEIVGG